ncbi:TonB-dependent receptor [Cupriavidus basilensis]|uniref:TonB-dependent receptor n=1 Tax=Cupriavidus basilensis TaxID=68895 RepID=UPI0039F6B739
MHPIFRAGATCIVISLPAAALACASCGCTLSSDWDSQGYYADAGLRLDLRYDYLTQAQLRSGTGAVNRSDYAIPSDRELEQRTINRYTTLGIDYSFNPDWAVNVQIPYVDRTHTTLSPGDTEVSGSSGNGPGDVRVVGRYQGLAESKNLGVQLGLKLPTGAFHQSFDRGPSAGTPLDRGVQLGTGTTDLLVGAYYYGAISQDFDGFAQVLLQMPLDYREQYKPGMSLSANLGVRYVGFDIVTPQLQINTRVAKRDLGDAADTPNSGGTLMYLSPGVTINLNRHIKLYAFVQLPIYQRVNGLQLAPRWTGTVGTRYVF